MVHEKRNGNCIPIGRNLVLKNRFIKVFIYFPSVLIYHINIAFP